MSAVAFDGNRGEALRTRLPVAAQARLGRIDWLAEVDSSNSVLLRDAANLPDRAALLVDGQTAGRGRRGRAWQSPVGANLYLSLFARLQRPLSAIGGLSLALGIGCVEALRAAGVDQVGLKWPNDLLADGRKLGGLLVEVAPDRQRGVGVVAGLGLNLAMPSDSAAGIDQPWIDLATLGHAGERADWAARLLHALLDTVDRFDADGFAPFAARWAGVDALAGLPLRITAADGEHLGQALGVADDGALRLRTAAGERLFHSADVSLRAK